MNLNGTPRGVFSTLINKLYAGDSGRDREGAMEVGDVETFKANNPLYTELTAMKVIAAAQLEHTEGLFSQTGRSVEGKSIYSFGLNSALSHMIRELKASPEARKVYEDSPFARNAWLLTQFTAGPALWQNKFELAYLDGIRNKFGNQEGSTRGGMSSREQQLTILGLFQNRNNPLIGHYVSLTHSDKTTTPILMNVPKLTRLRDAASGKISSHVLDAVFKSVFMSEYSRIKANADVDIAKYAKGSQLFYMLPLFNYSVMKTLVEAQEISPGIFNAIWQKTDSKEQPKLNSVSNPAFEGAVKKMIEMQLNEMVNATTKSWEDSGLLETGFPASQAYIDRLLADENLLQENQDWLTPNMERLDDRQVQDMKLRAIATDFTINSFLVNTSMAQMFTGDPALVFKENLEKTFVEYGKRLAKDIAPGRDGNFGEGATYVTITAKDYQPFIKELEGVPGYDTTVDATDAQEFVTAKEHITVLYAYGKITEEQFTQAMKRITDAGSDYYDFEGLNIPMHPMKPVAAGLQAPVNGVMTYDYVKSSALPLYPPMTHGLELDKLRRGMERTDVDRLNFSTAKKIGAPINSVELFDNATGKINSDVFDSPAWTGEATVRSARQVLNRTQFRIQQEMPYDETKETIRTVSQMNKLLTQGIELVKTPFMLNGEEISGKNLRAYKEHIRKELITHQFNEFLDKIGGTYDKENRTLSFKNKRAFYDLLKEEALNRQGYTLNDLAALQSFVNGDTLTVPLIFTPSASRFEGLMMSMIKNIVKVKIPGKSFVQATPAGFKTMGIWEETPMDHSKIVWTTDFSTDIPMTEAQIAEIEKQKESIESARKKALKDLHTKKFDYMSAEETKDKTGKLDIYNEETAGEEKDIEVDATEAQKEIRKQATIINNLINCI
jgi:hypothetical protein